MNPAIHLRSHTPSLSKHPTALPMKFHVCELLESYLHTSLQGSTCYCSASLMTDEQDSLVKECVHMHQVEGCKKHTG